MTEPTILSRDGSVHVTDERFNALSHLVGACLALLGTVALVTHASVLGDRWKIVGLTVYGVSLVMLFATSAAHHWFDRGARVNEVLRTLDYGSVFGLIAGTVTPLVLVVFRNPLGWSVLGTVWFIAIAGIVVRSVWWSLAKELTSTLYIVLGWMPVALLLSPVDLPLGALALMAAGGLVYSVGFAVFVLERPNPWPGVFGFHEIWHVLVMIAAGLHFWLMAAYVLTW